jgi:hypothetical protein
MMTSRKLSEIAKTIRSKNAGVDKITFDVIFPDRATYARGCGSGILSRAAARRRARRNQFSHALFSPFSGFDIELSYGGVAN